MTGAEALLKIGTLPEHLGDQVLSYLAIPRVYEAQRILADQLGREEGDAVLAALVRARWSALATIHNRHSG